MRAAHDRPIHDRTRRGRPRSVAVAALVAVVALVASSCVLNGDWEALTPVNPTPSAPYGLEGVSCPTTDFCMAIGSRPGAFAGLASVQTWDGATWTESTLDPDISGPLFFGIEITDVACASPTSCVVAWLEFSDDEDIPGVSGWNGTSWTHRQGDFSSSSYHEVACAPGGSCIAVADAGYTAVWNGSSFSTVPGDGPSHLVGLACPTSTDCIGIYPDGFTRAWDGSTWTWDAELPVYEDWRSIACTSPDNCLAVGGYAGDPVAARFDGTVWTLTPVPVTGGRLISVSCTNIAACVAVGTATVGTPAALQNVALGWNGGDWYRLDDPPSSADASYGAVSCAPGDRCVAVGSAAGGGGRVPAAATYAWEPLS